MRTFESLWTKFVENGRAYRNGFVASELKRLIPFQIHAMRKSRGWSQGELARRSGLTQGVISRAEDPDYGNLTFNTVIAIARGFDVAFIGRFAPFSELDNYVVGLSETSAGSVLSFTEESHQMVQNLGKVPQQIVGAGRLHELGSLSQFSTANELETASVGQWSFSTVQTEEQQLMGQEV